MSFERSLDDASIQALMSTKLFNDYLRDDCQNGDVFPAIRRNRVDFYYRGGKLFSWENGKGKGFSTHHKYASVLCGQDKHYVTESQLKAPTVRLIKDFCEGYFRIKENCALYSGLEATGVSALYHAFSCANHKKHDVSVLDIEVAFANEDYSSERSSSDRIDFVTIDVFGKLRFFEAKHYSNRTSLRCDGGVPPLCAQLTKYDGYLQKFESVILESYVNHVNAIMKLFSVDIPMPKSIDPITRAIIFGFDNEQRGYLNKNIIDIKDDAERYPLRHRTYAIGDIAKADLPTIFRGGKQNWD